MAADQSSATMIGANFGFRSAIHLVMFEQDPRVGGLTNALASSINKPSLYFIGAMKSEGTETRDRFDSVWESIVQPTAEKLGVDAKNAVAVGTVQIMPAIVKGLLSSHVIVADITGENTSVGYEIGIAHSHAKCIILMKQDGWQCGFDLKDINHICYGLDSAGIGKAKKKLEEHIRHCEQSKWMSHDNPVMYALAPVAASLAPEATNAISSFAARYLGLSSGPILTGVPPTTLAGSASRPVPAPTEGALRRRIKLL